MTKPAPKPAIGRAAGEFKTLHDKTAAIAARVRAAIGQLGPDRWAYEHEFIRLAGLANVQLPGVRDNFSEFWFALEPGKQKERRIWCGSARLAKQLKDSAQ